MTILLAGKVFSSVTDEYARAYVAVRRAAVDSAACACLARGWADNLLGFVDGTASDGSTPAGYDGYGERQSVQKDIGAHVYSVFAK